MVLLDVWEYSHYEWGNAIDIVLWMSAIVAAVFALLLLASYLNTRKTEHLYWGISFALLWINTHIGIVHTLVERVAFPPPAKMIQTRGAGFWTFLEPVNAAFFALAVGLFAVGLWKNVKPEKDKIGNYLLYYVIVMSIAIGFFKNENMILLLGTPAILVPILVMALHIPSAILIIWLPLQTRDENGKSALAMPIAGILMSMVGLLLAVATLDILTGVYLTGFIYVALSLFPFVYLLAICGFAWGTFVPKRWAFDIAGIELEA